MTKEIKKLAKQIQKHVNDSGWDVEARTKILALLSWIEESKVTAKDCFCKCTQVNRPLYNGLCARCGLAPDMSQKDPKV